MKTAIVEVGAMLFVLGAEGVRRQLQKVPGVNHAEVSYVAQSVTVHYDEQQITVEDIRKRVVECGYHCRGEMVPNHLCETPDGTSSSTIPAAAGQGHHEHHIEAAPAAMPTTTGVTPADGAVERAADAAAVHAPGHGGAVAAAHAEHAMGEMMHDMGHVPGMSMQDMFRDMRNRFLVALVFSVPVFLYSPTGKMFGDFADVLLGKRVQAIAMRNDGSELPELQVERRRCCAPAAGQGSRVNRWRAR